MIDIACCKLVVNIRTLWSKVINAIVHKYVCLEWVSWFQKRFYFRIIDIACCTLVVNIRTLWSKVINAIVHKYVCLEWRSEEHTSELQSRFDLVCRLLLEKKK